MVSKEELINLATLAKLDISDQDVDKLLADMEKIIEFANQINSAFLHNCTNDKFFEKI